MKSILIIGCGLLGSSLVRKIQKKKIFKNIFIYEKSKKNLKKIKKLRLKVRILKKLDLNLLHFDLIVLCTPMSEYKNIILKINKYLNSKTILTDVGSSKLEISKIIKKNLKKNINWVPSHPIAGSEVSGPENGSVDLFDNKWCVIIKDKNSNSKKINFLKTFWKKIGSKVIIMDSNKHDKIFSMTSHLPHLIAYNLVMSAQDFEKKQKYDLIKFSAGGLRDFSRIAASNEIMWRDIFFTNKRNISKAIDLFVRNLNSLKRDIKLNNDKAILRKLIQTKKVRSKIIKLKQDINKPDFGRV